VIASISDVVSFLMIISLSGSFLLLLLLVLLIMFIWFTCKDSFLL
jgi:hypothetical protein